MGFESFPVNNTEGEEGENGDNLSQNLDVNSKKDFLGVLEEKLNLDNKSFTDGELVGLVEEVGVETELGGKIFEGDKDRPKIFYRCFRNNEVVQKLISGDENIIRPFSFSMPGSKGEISLSYGGDNPVVTRIIDTTGEWEDSGKFSGQAKGQWNEAINLNPVALRKVGEKKIRVSEIYSQVGREVSGDEEVLEITYVVDKNKTKELRESGDLDVFRDDAGFWKEIGRRARYLERLSGNENMRKLELKYLDYFKAMFEVDGDLIEDETAKKEFETSKSEIENFLERVKAVKEGDRNWSLEDKQMVLEKLSSVSS